MKSKLDQSTMIGFASRRVCLRFAFSLRVCLRVIFTHCVILRYFYALRYSAISLCFAKVDVILSLFEVKSKLDQSEIQVGSK